MDCCGLADNLHLAVQQKTILSQAEGLSNFVAFYSKEKKHCRILDLGSHFRGSFGCVANYGSEWYPRDQVQVVAVDLCFQDHDQSDVPAGVTCLAIDINILLKTEEKDRPEACRQKFDIVILKEVGTVNASYLVTLCSFLEPSGVLITNDYLTNDAEREKLQREGEFGLSWLWPAEAWCGPFLVFVKATTAATDRSLTTSDPDLVFMYKLMKCTDLAMLVQHYKEKLNYCRILDLGCGFEGSYNSFQFAKDEKILVVGVDTEFIGLTEDRKKQILEKNQVKNPKNLVLLGLEINQLLKLWDLSTREQVCKKPLRTNFDIIIMKDVHSDICCDETSSLRVACFLEKGGVFITNENNKEVPKDAGCGFSNYWKFDESGLFHIFIRNTDLGLVGPLCQQHESEILALQRQLPKK